MRYIIKGDIMNLKYRNNIISIIKTIIKYLKKYVLHIFFLIALYLSIKWSEIPLFKVLDYKIINQILCHKKAVDASMLNIATGYITGYFVYLLTVFIPQQKRKKPVEKEVISKLSSFYKDSVYLLLLMCKNCCTEEEWKEVHNGVKSDIECFNDKFYRQIKKLDINSDADTAFLHKVTKNRMKWYEYLEMKCQNFYEILNELFLQYHTYLDDKIINKIIKAKNSNFIDLFVGNGNSLKFCIQSSEDHVWYYENLPIGMFILSDKPYKLFGDNQNVQNVQNINILVDYIDNLGEIHTLLLEYKNKYKLDTLREDYSISKLRGNEVGHYNTAV